MGTTSSQYGPYAWGCTCAAPGKLHLSASNKLLGGVCGGIGEYFGVDATWVRIAVVILVLWLKMPAALFYFILWAILPRT